MKNNNVQIPKYLFWLGFIVFLLPLSFRQLIDVDVWWHMQLGRSVLEQGFQISFEKLYFSPIAETVPDLRFTWLGDVLLYLVHSALGDVGLQILRLACVLMSCGLLILMSGEKHTSRLLLILMAFIAGTYQLQLMRNAIFGLPLTSLVIFLWWRHAFHDDKRSLWLIPAVIAVWGVMHGSYLLGMGLFGLMLMGSALDQLRQGKALELRLWGLRCGALFAAFLSVSYKNPLTAQMLSGSLDALQRKLLPIVLVLVAGAAIIWWGRRRKWTHTRFYRLALVGLSLSVVLGFAVFAAPYVQDPTPVAKIDLRAPEQFHSIQDLSFFGKLNEALNNTFWKTKNDQFASTDFQSPFDHLSDVYIWVSLLVGLIIWLLVATGTTVPHSMLWPFLGICILGTGYVRVTGFIALLGCFILVTVQSRFKLHQRWKLFFRVLCGLAVTTALALGVTRVSIGFDLWQTHVVGIGRAPYYSNTCVQKLLDDYPDDKVFTTITNGGYVLYNWYPEKKVFMDGFFAPHRGETFENYKKILIDGNPDLLFENYGIETALVTLEDLKWINVFATSQAWVPRYMDTGMVVYHYRPDLEEPLNPPELLFSPDEMAEIPAYYREVVHNRLFELVSSLIIKGRLEEANAFVATHGDYFGAIGSSSGQASRQRMEQNLVEANQRYDGKNNILMYYESRFATAKASGKYSEALKRGEAILEVNRENPLFLLEMAEIAFGASQYDAVAKYARLLWAFRNSNQSFWESHASRVANLLNTTAQEIGVLGRYSQSFELMRDASNLDPRIVDRESLLRWGLSLFQSAQEKDQVFEMYDILKAVESEFPQSPHLNSNMAWLYFKYHQQIGGSLQDAERYARAALDAPGMESIEDYIWNQLADIVRAMGRPDQARQYVQRALDSAPQLRKDMYRNKLKDSP